MLDILDVDACLSQLHLTDTEAAELLSVDTRTIRRWKKNLQEIPGPARAALRAWCRLDTLGLAWQPDAIGLGEHDSDRLALQVAAYREHAIALDATLRRVAERGGPAAPWEVNLETRRARQHDNHLLRSLKRRLLTAELLPSRHQARFGTRPFVARGWIRSDCDCHCEGRKTMAVEELRTLTWQIREMASC